MKLLYFAWVRDRIGKSTEELEWPHENETVDYLLNVLKSKGENYLYALEDRHALRVAVNQEFAELDTPLCDKDEVAIFPPVTGG